MGRRLAILAVSALAAASCGASADTVASTADPQVSKGEVDLERLAEASDPAATAPGADAVGDAGSADPDPGSGESAPHDGTAPAGGPGFGTPAGNARRIPAPVVPDGPVPVGIVLPTIGVEAAPIVDVGVEPDGAMEVPGAEQVGWYRFGPTPGAAGSAVLAAHIAYEGRDGVFRHLADLDPGDTFVVAYDDGALVEFVVVGLEQYAKDELPFDLLFSDAGAPRVALITCGGSFNPQLRSYDDNIVAIAVPVDAG